MQGVRIEEVANPAGQQWEEGNGVTEAPTTKKQLQLHVQSLASEAAGWTRGR